ncbi:MAG: hypothetical protein OEW30_14015 [Acidimicrobiia bacterium]|nr:hypothetical protein [Acidimicrobiia bacterium]
MKTHKLDAISLVFGAIFALMGLAFLVFENPWRSLLIDVQWSWLAPLALIALGVAILTPLFRRTSSATTLLDEAPDPEAIEELTPSPLD